MEQLGHTDAIHLIGFTYARVTRLLQGCIASVECYYEHVKVMRVFSKNNSRRLEERRLNGPWIFLKQVPPGRGLPQADGASAALATKTGMFWIRGV